MVGVAAAAFKQAYRDKALITAASSAPDRSQAEALARSGPMATSKRRKVTTTLHITVRNRP